MLVKIKWPQYILHVCTTFSIFNFCSTFCPQNTYVHLKQFRNLKILIIQCIYNSLEILVYIKIRKTFNNFVEMVCNHIFQSEYDQEVVLSCVKCLLKESDPLGFVKVANRIIRTFTRWGRDLWEKYTPGKH